jgi:hypothetical protein
MGDREEGNDLRDALLDELRLLRDELGVPPRTIDMGKYGRFSPALYSDRFGSWEEALKEAGIEDEPHRPPDDVEPELNAEREVSEGVPEKDAEKETEDLDEHQRLVLRSAERVEGVPTPENLRRRGHPVNEIIDEYGTWEDALASVGIELPERMRARKEEKRRRGRSDEEKLLREVRKYRSVHGHGPSEEDVEGTDWMSSVEKYRETFGTVWGAVDSIRERERVKDDEPSEDELVAELKRYYLRNGEVPTRGKVREEATLSDMSSYIDAFGDLRSAVEASGLKERAEGSGDE